MQDKVFVSPGVYTSERDLSFVTTNVGVTTLGLVGEVTKGPAFKPIFVSNYNEFKTFFGGLNPKKNKETGFVQYELPYVAKSYLSNSNQLYVTRVLGLSGYDAGPAYVITVDAIVVAVLRSRGTYVDNVFVPAATSVTKVVASGNEPEGVFSLTIDGETFQVSLDKKRKDYITRIFGKDAQDGKSPLYVEEVYPKIYEGITDKSTIGFNQNTTLNNYKEQYQAAYTPYIVSEVKGVAGNPQIERLFRFKTIADGDSANTNVKVSFMNIRPDERAFDVVVRDYNDGDSNPALLERFNNLTMDPNDKNYIARRIGTVNGDYISSSAYILVEMVEGDDTITDSFPAGFEGYPMRASLTESPDDVKYKVSYGTYENKRRVYLGWAPDMDSDILKYKGLEQDATDPTLYTPLLGKTKGFHLDTEATGADFVGGMAEFKNENALINTPYEKRYSRKFTVAFAGGFDGWDVYRKNRTNSDEYTIQRLDIDNQGLFEYMSLSDGDMGVKSDYYAFLEAIRTFSNPQSININVFATPGIDVVNQPSLIDYTIEMVERERSDSLYIVTTPDVDADGLVKSPGDVVADLYGMYDSNYTATYWPWVQVKDNENNALVFIPPTGDVVRNIALTDNTSYPWFAVAGFARGDVKAEKARIKLTQAQRDTLYEGRINPIATFSGEGCKIFGNKNLQLKNSALDRINVRRLLLQTRKLISAVAVRLLFDQNDEALRSEFLRQVNPILESIRKERGLTDFRVKLEDNPEDADRNSLTGKIFIKPTSALEYIELEFNVMPTGASFEDL